VSSAENTHSCAQPTNKTAFIWRVKSSWQTNFFYPRWYVCTTRVYVLLCCCCCCCCSCWNGHINQNTALLSNFTMLSAYFCTIVYSLACQPCARLLGSLACACPLLSRQVQTGSAEFARSAIQTSPNRFSRILHHIAPCFYEWVHSSQFTIQLVKSVQRMRILKKSVAVTCRSPNCIRAQFRSLPNCSTAALPSSHAEKFASCFTAVGRHACMQYCILFTRPAV
jgi:hypothetical protein